MYSGIVEETGEVVDISKTTEGSRVVIATPLSSQITSGDSISISGVCLTAKSATDQQFFADATKETLRRSTLKDLDKGARVNLELPLRPNDRLGGHFVQGHVDGVGKIVDVKPDGFAQILTISAPNELLRYIVEKGSITVEGVSLTVVDVTDRDFTISLIPETQQRTTLGSVKPGQPVNLEVDVLAKYVEKLVNR